MGAGRRGAVSGSDHGLIVPAFARYATKPTPGAQHDADAVARLATVMGRPLMPWQYQVIRIASERSPADPRRYRYRVVRVSIPRQGGKTTLVAVKATHRTIGRRRHGSFYTAQTGKDARARWGDLRKIIEDSPLNRFVEPGNRFGGSIRLGAGDTSITWPNGSEIRPFAPTAASLHGYTPPDVDRDEVWNYDELTGQALDGAIGPAQITIPHAQRWDLSTMGDADSTYWHGLVDEGRQAVDDPDATIAYFEWSADPDSDLYDPANWATFHPALGYTIALEDLQAAANRETAGVWQRAYCNLRTSTREAVVDMAAFRRLADPQLRVAAKGAALAFDVAGDLTQASIAIARPAGEDGVAVRIVKTAGAVAWLADELCKLSDAWSIPQLHANDDGPVRDTIDELRRRGRDVVALNGKDYATACGAWLRRTRDGRLTWDGSKSLHDAQQAAALRPMGDAVAFSRRHSAGPIDALVAAAVAVRAALLAPPPAPPPMIRTA